MTRGESVLAAAAREIGYHQGAHQHTKYGEWFGMDNCPWCVIFAAAWCYNQAGAVGSVVGQKFDNGGLYSCSQTLNWYKTHAPECITDKPVPGCLVIFDLPNTKYSTDHMGLFVKIDGGKIITIDGNTSNTSEGNGGWVQQRQRRLKDLDNVWYIVPHELEDDEMDIDRMIDEFTPEQVYRLASKLYDTDLYKLYSRLEGYMDKQPLPTSWDAATELREAMTLGITDGSHPMIPARRYETAIMCKRAVKP